MALPVADSLLGTYLQFLRSPTLTLAHEALPFSVALRKILRLYTPHFLLVLIAGLLISRMSGVQDDSILNEIMTQMPAWQLFLFVVVAAPVIEESIFRLPMRPFAVNIAFSSTVVLFYLMLILAPAPPIVIFAAGALIGFNIYLWIKRRNMKVFQPFYKRYGIAIFYFLTLIFGAVHITNYEPQVWPLLPLLVLPQTIVALWFGFVRIRYGFRWAIFAHAFHNGCLLLPLCLTKLFGSDQVQSWEALNIETLTGVDQVLVVIIGLYMMGGLAASITIAWKLVKEYLQQQPTVSK